MRGTYTRHRLLFDTNILLDVIVLSRPQSEEARRVLELCNGGGDMGFACSLSFKDAYYVLTKQYGEQRARALVEALMDTLIIAPVSAEECDLSLQSDEPDFEDGLVRAAAELNDIDFIITRDGDAYRRSTIRSLTAAEYLELFDAE